MMVKHNSHRKPIDILEMSYGARESYKELAIQKRLLLIEAVFFYVILS
jgi:hypothetical protein